MATAITGFDVVPDPDTKPEKPAKVLCTADQEAVDALLEAIRRIYLGQPGSAIRRAMEGVRELSSQYDLHIPY